MIFVGGRDMGEPAPTRKECLRNLNSLVCPALSGFFEAGTSTNPVSQGNILESSPLWEL
jgi:hypothetical protein